VNTSNDTLSTTTIAVGNLPGLMAVSPGREITLVLSTGNNQVSIITNSNESVNASTIQLPDVTESMIAQNTALGYAAFRNAGGGQVLVLDLANVKVLFYVSVPKAHRLVLNHSGTELLVFSDGYSCPVAGGSGTALTVLNLANVTASTPAPPTATVVCGFNEAVSGVFSSDDSQAYIMNCGPECGTTSGTAGVAMLNMASNSITSVVQLPSAGATVGLLNGTSLFVAGTLNGAPGAGTLTTLNMSSGLPSSAPAPVPIADGYHSLMALGATNKLFVGGSLNCTTCLTIYDTSANTAKFGAFPGPVTGMVPIANRTVAYVAVGGALKIYDTTTSAELSAHSINIVGQAVDVKAVDQTQ
jgi:hypothetical protein